MIGALSQTEAQVFPEALEDSLPVCLSFCLSNTFGRSVSHRRAKVNSSPQRPVAYKRARGCGSEGAGLGLGLAGETIRG